MPIRIPGPPSCTSSVPAGKRTFSVWSALIVPSPPALMIGLWKPRRTPSTVCS